MNYHFDCSLKARMNFNFYIDIIYLLEEDGFYDIAKINEIPTSYFQTNPLISFNIIKVRYVNLSEIKEKICNIDELKKYFNFIKIFAGNEKELNILLVNRPYSSNDILQKINESGFFGNEFKLILNIQNFPFNKFKLEEKYNQNILYYNKIYQLINIQINSNNVSFINNINSNNQIIEKISYLNERLYQMEIKFKKRLLSNSDEFNKKIDKINKVLSELI